MDLDTVTSEEKIENLLFEQRSCTSCGLHRNRKVLLCGKGSPSTHLVAVIDRVGPRAAVTGDILSSGEGRFLNTLFKRAGMSPAAIWVTPVVSCPTGGLRPQPRRIEMLPAPKKSEVEACNTRLHQEIHLIEPCLIFAFGSASVNALVPNVKVQEVQGRVVEAFIQGDLIKYPVPTMALPSVNQLYRNPSQKVGGIWNKTLDNIRVGLDIAHRIKSLRRNQHG